MAAPLPAESALAASLFADPQATMLELDRLEAEASLAAYARLVWPVLEPARPFVRGWVIDAISEHLEAVSSGQIRRLLINVPPGTSKSMLVSVLWPSWEWGPQNRPDLRYVFAAYAEALTIRDNRRCRNVIQSALFQALWGERFGFDPDQNAKGRYDTTARGFRIATSVEGLGTGERGDRFVIDDPHSVGEVESEASRESTLRWFAEVVPTRLNDPDRSAIVCIMQRTHARDVSGLILRSELGYEWLCLPMEYEASHRCFTSVPRSLAPGAAPAPELRALVAFEGEPIPRWVAPDDPVPPDREPVWREVFPQDPRSVEGELLWPERFSQEYLEKDLKPALRSWGGTYAEAGQLQQRPAPREGGLVKRDDFRFWDGELPAGVDARGWDLAGSEKKGAKFTAGVKLRRLPNGRILVLDVRRDRKSPGRLEAWLRATAEGDGPSCLVSLPQDPGQAGLWQKGALAAVLEGFAPHFSPESGDKVTRFMPFAAQVEAGNVYLVRASWNDAFINELCAFPGGEFTDQADACSRAYARVRSKRAELVGAPPQQTGAALGPDGAGR